MRHLSSAQLRRIRFRGNLTEMIGAIFDDLIATRADEELMAMCHHEVFSHTAGSTWKLVHVPTGAVATGPSREVALFHLRSAIVQLSTEYDETLRRAGETQ